MRFFIALVFINHFSKAVGAEESNIYRCRFENEPVESAMIRMKKYYDTSQGIYLGKVDLIKDYIEIESTPTKVYQIPLRGDQTYMQIWYATDVRVDAQLFYNQGIREFHATYTKSSKKSELTCAEIRN